MKNKPIYVTMPSLAPLEEFTKHLEGVWQRGILTNNGPLVKELETQLQDKMSLKNFLLVTNGTIAIQMAIKALELKGEIIVPAFTWIATISAIQWEGCKPVICDIDTETLNIDPSKIEALITKETVAIMPVHVFGNPCEVNTIQEIANKYNLKVIYDGAHAIGSTYDNRSLLSYGDISATSLHATKLTNTGEGGACITNSTTLNDKLSRIRFFGHNEDKTNIIEEGFNGKMTEIHAALGLANMKYFDKVLEDRKSKYFRYKSNLSSNKKIRFQKLHKGECNYSYFPIILTSEKEVLECIKTLSEFNIYPRRYFYPSVNNFTHILGYQSAPNSEDISKRILCLPLYFTLQNKEIDFISDAINKIL